MLLSVLGFLIVITFMVLIMCKRVSGFIALVLVPVVYAWIGGFGPFLSKMMFDGVKDVAPTGIMMLFAVIFFGVMVDVGLFDALILFILRKVGGDPLKIVVGSAILATVASLEGEGAVIFMITCTAMLPLYRRLGISPVILAVICTMITAVKNMFPWAAPTARVLSVLKLDSAVVFQPLIPVIVMGFIWVLFSAWWMGRAERKRLGISSVDAATLEKIAQDVISKNPESKRPKMFWFNLVWTIAIMAALLVTSYPISVVFMVGAAVALLANFRGVKLQQKHLMTHAHDALSVCGVVFAAGVFMGILTSTKMCDAMAESLITIIPSSIEGHMGMITAIISAPLSFLLSNDAFYFGILPVLVKIGAAHGVGAAEIGRASLLGTPVHMLSPLVAALWLLVGMCDISFAELQKKGIVCALGLMAVNIITAVITGAINF